MTALGWLLKIVAIPVLLALALVAATLVANQVPLAAEPGITERLRTYLGSNRVETLAGSRFPEREPMVTVLPPAQAYQEAREAVRDLGWELLAENPDRYRLHAEVRTPILRFQDDFRLEIESVTGGGSRIQIRSSSRVGQADFGANTRHLLDFQQVFQGRISD